MCNNLDRWVCSLQKSRVASEAGGHEGRLPGPRRAPKLRSRNSSVESYVFDRKG